MFDAEIQKEQIDLLRINLKAARLNQIQDGGAFFINQIKDIIITIIAASLVINGVFSLGTVLAIQLILGLLNAPVQQLVTFIRTSFDVKLCLKRILEVHNKEEENISDSANGNDAIGSQDLIVRNVSFKYNFLYDFVLKDISFTIPKGKITAIVGSSGSGKTTLIKLLLGFYKPTEGNILLGNRDMPQIPIDRWRKECGVVLQDGYIFSDTIANNISESDESVDIQKLEKASEIANLNEFVEGLTLGFQTMIGSKGTGLSQGQKQRILIARAVYKDPSYLFFDEATNALDTQNEKEIIGKLNNFYKEKSVVVVAHRLSTVRNADQIIVLSKGEISEIGTHNELIAKKSVYYNLIRNQLELEQS
jgi:ATP-binding cassette subfamily B protein